MEAKFEQLQARLRELAPQLTVRSFDPDERTIVVVHSLSLDVPRRLLQVMPAYEERFLCLVLSIVRQPATHVVYLTSQPILPRLVDYWLRLVPRVDREEIRSRLSVLSVGDSTPRPLTEKILEHPRLIERIRQRIVAPERSVLLPFNVSPLECELAVRLGIPVYGPSPEHAWIGTKSGSRRIFEEEGVEHPAGVEDVSSLGDVVSAIEEIQRRRPAARQVIVKLNDGVSGLGNGLIALGARAAQSARGVALEDPQLSSEEFYEHLARQGGIVEEVIEGEGFCSPSAQLRALPDGTVEVLSTHDQILGGPHGQTYLGCRLPADPAYATAIGREARRVGERLAREGVIGRFAVDFVAVRDGDDWRAYAVEINLRNGGTSHPVFTLQALTDGEYEEATGRFLAGSGQEKYYLATDDLESPAYRSLTPDDALDIAEAEGIGWDDDRQIGVALHMVSAIAIAGRIGLTAIGDTPAEADALYRNVKSVFDAETRPEAVGLS
jgi:hypothetical protein